MNCREIRRWLSPYLDSELGKTKTFEVSEHLRECSACAKRFESERRVDTLMAEKLADVPAMDFGAMLREAAQPKRALLGPWRLGAVGLAACVALVAWSMIGLSPAGSGGVEDWIAAEFAAVAPAGKAFVPVSGASTDLLGQVESTLGVSLAMKSIAEAFPGHVVEVVRVARRSRGGRAPYVEVRLNCCGEPVLVAFAARSDVEDFGRLPEDVESGSVRRHESSGLTIATWASGELVLVAASRHSVSNIIPAFSVKAA